MRFKQKKKYTPRETLEDTEEANEKKASDTECGGNEKRSRKGNEVDFQEIERFRDDKWSKAHREYTAREIRLVRRETELAVREEMEAEGKAAALADMEKKEKARQTVSQRTLEKRLRTMEAEATAARNTPMGENLELMRNNADIEAHLRVWMEEEHQNRLVRARRLLFDGDLMTPPLGRIVLTSRLLEGQFNSEYRKRDPQTSSGREDGSRNGKS
jgi:hypothetical protein